MRFMLALITALFTLAPYAAPAQLGNGKLQIHFMDVGQGDGALLISPFGETVLFDNGVRNNCDKPVSYLQQLGVTSIDYHVASHYHDDHIGCTAEVFAEFPLTRTGFDRGGTYHTGTFSTYRTTLGTSRQTATPNQEVMLDATSPNPVRIQFVALNGAGVSTTNENDLSLVAVIRFGQFDAEIGGDLSGFKENGYEDIETPVRQAVGQVEVYKVHHHGSRYSSNDGWLDVIRPRVGIISAGLNNKHNHPTFETIERLHTKNVPLFWTSEGGGIDPEVGMDTVGSNIIVEAGPNAQSFTVRHTRGPQVQEFAMWNATAGPSTATFAWSKKSSVYHQATCLYVQNIAQENLETGTTAPQGKKLHAGCPR